MRSSGKCQSYRSKYRGLWQQNKIKTREVNTVDFDSGVEVKRVGPLTITLLQKIGYTWMYREIALL